MTLLNYAHRGCSARPDKLLLWLVHSQRLEGSRSLDWFSFLWTELALWQQTRHKETGLSCCSWTNFLGNFRKSYVTVFSFSFQMHRPVRGRLNNHLFPVLRQRWFASEIHSSSLHKNSPGIHGNFSESLRSSQTRCNVTLQKNPKSCMLEKTAVGREVATVVGMCFYPYENVSELLTNGGLKGLTKLPTCFSMLATNDFHLVLKIPSALFL